MPSRQLSSLSLQSSSASTTMIITATVFITFIIIIVIIYFIYRRCLDTISVPHLIQNTSIHIFQYNHLLAATNSFSPHNIIGKGASATVYLGILPTGKSVAVKLISTSTAHLEFHNELHILSRLNSPYIIPLLGYCVRKTDLILVYEYMPNRSLQETLFDEKTSTVRSDGLGWDQRFKIVQDVAKALSYLHLECEPPVIHGDVKPSNVLLDRDFRARVSDFGLSRVKKEDVDVVDDDEFVGTPFSQELSGNVMAVDGSRSSRHCSYNEVDFAQQLKGLGCLKSECVLKDDHLVIGEDLEEGRQWGRDWWWRQDGSGELCSKDYVTEWIGSQICQGNVNSRDWDDEDGEKSARQVSLTSPEFNDSVPMKCVELGLVKKEGKSPIAGRDKKMRKKLHEWWGEEDPVEISKTRVRLRKLEKKLSKSFKEPILALSRSVKLRRKRKIGEHGGMHYCDPDMDFSFRKGLKRNKKAHSEGSELWSGDLFSRELSSTTSMRGTLCYIAPEGGGGCGYLMEKADIYSLGVLILVIVSGRRPLHVLSSPMKLEKANLVSWCRQLAQSGNVLELIDMRLKTQGYNKDQAKLCINLALSCLQKMPELRPDAMDVVKVLNGEMDIPDLPFEFTPSPPTKSLSRSRSRHNSRGG